MSLYMNSPSMYPSGPKLERIGLVGDSIACRPSSVISCAILKAYKTNDVGYFILFSHYDKNTYMDIQEMSLVN